MADVTISQLTKGIPSGSALLPYSTGSQTLASPLSSILQNNTFQGPVGITGQVNITSTTGAVSITRSGGNQLSLISTTPYQWDLDVDDSGGNNFRIRNMTADLAPFTINTAGSVGIGTITPSAKLDVNGSIRSSDGIPYNQRQAGSVTTNASGNARIDLSGWFWGDVTSYQRAMLIMFGIKNVSVNYIGTWLGWFGGQTINQLATSSQQGVNWVGVISVRDFSNTGTRWIDLAGLPANTTFTYEIRSAAVGAGFMSSYGDF